MVFTKNRLFIPGFCFDVMVCSGTYPKTTHVIELNSLKLLAGLSEEALHSLG